MIDRAELDMQFFSERSEGGLSLICMCTHSWEDYNLHENDWMAADDDSEGQ